MRRELQFEELREEEKHWCDWSERERERLPFALHRANLGGNNILEHFGMIENTIKLYLPNKRKRNTL